MRRENMGKKCKINSLEFLNAGIDEIYYRKKHYVENGLEFCTFKCELAPFFARIERVFKGVFLSDISLDIECIDLGAFQRIFPVAYEKLYGNKFIMYNKDGKTVEVSGISYLTWFIERLRNINMHAVIGDKLDLLFKMDMTFINFLPIISPNVRYVKNGVLTVGGMIVMLFSILDDKSIHEKEHVSYAGTFATRWGALIWNDETKWQYQNNKKRFAEFFRNNFQTNYEIAIREQLPSNDVLHSIFGNQYKNLTLRTNENKQKFSIDLYKRTHAKGFGCSGSIEYSSNACTVIINSGSNWGVYFKQQYILHINNNQEFINMADSLPPFMFIAFLYAMGISVYTNSTLNEDATIIAKKLNKAKFYRDKGLSILLAPTTKADIREIGKASTAGLINIFLNFEEKVVFKEHINVYKGYSKLSEALTAINCPTALSDRLIALRNFSAHAYLLDEYIIGRTAYRIDLEFILSTLKDFIEYLSNVYGKESDFNYYTFFDKKVNALILNRLIGVKYKRVYANSIKLFFRQDNLMDKNTLDKQINALNLNFGVINNSIMCDNIEDKYFCGKKYVFSFHRGEFKQPVETKYLVQVLEKVVLRFNEEYEVNRRKGNIREMTFFKITDYERSVTINGMPVVYKLVFERKCGIINEKIYEVRKA